MILNMLQGFETQMRSQMGGQSALNPLGPGPAGMGGMGGMGGMPGMGGMGGMPGMGGMGGMAPPPTSGGYPTPAPRAAPAPAPEPFELRAFTCAPDLQMTRLAMKRLQVGRRGSSRLVS